MQKGKKMEKYRSFPRAIYKDSSGNKKIVVATDEDVGKGYYCEYCDARMRRTHLRNGKSAFILENGQEHLDKRCKYMDKHGTFPSLNIITPENLINELCFNPKKRLNPNSKSTKIQENSCDSDTELYKMVKERSPKNLKEIAELIMNYYKPYDKIGDFTIADFLIRYKWLNSIVEGNQLKPVGGRIFEAKTGFHDRNNQNLIFTIFTNSITIYIIVHFDILKYFNETVKSTFNIEENNNRTKYHPCPDKELALIVSKKWSILRNEQLQNLIYKPNKNCIGAYYTTIDTKKQIYFFNN